MFGLGHIGPKPSAPPALFYPTPSTTLWAGCYVHFIDKVIGVESWSQGYLWGKGISRNQIPGLPGSKACPREEKERGREKRKWWYCLVCKAPTMPLTLHLPLLCEGPCYSSTAPGPGLYSLPLINEYMCLSIVQFYNVGTVSPLYSWGKHYYLKHLV